MARLAAVHPVHLVAAPLFPPFHLVLPSRPVRLVLPSHPFRLAPLVVAPLVAAPLFPLHEAEDHPIPG
jgi:hypothetical protein